MTSEHKPCTCHCHEFTCDCHTIKHGMSPGKTRWVVVMRRADESRHIVEAETRNQAKALMLAKYSNRFDAADWAVHDVYLSGEER